MKSYILLLLVLIAKSGISMNIEGLIQNTGILYNSDGTPNSDVQYLIHHQNHSIYLEEEKLHFVKYVDIDDSFYRATVSTMFFPEGFALSVNDENSIETNLSVIKGVNSNFSPKVMRSVEYTGEFATFGVGDRVNDFFLQSNALGNEESINITLDENSSFSINDDTIKVNNDNLSVPLFIGHDIVSIASISFDGRELSIILPNLGGLDFRNPLPDHIRLREVSNLGVEWGTYFGGENNDDINAIATNETMGIFAVVGNTKSRYFPITNIEGRILTRYDGFISVF